MDNSVSCQDVEKIKFLFGFTKNELEKEDARWDSVDKKAIGLTPILGLLLGAAGFFGKWLLDEKMLPPYSALEWIAFVCVISAFISIL